MTFDSTATANEVSAIREQEGQLEIEGVSIADRMAIEALYTRQSHAVDESDSRDWAATFTADGVFESPTYRLTARGTNELEAFARSSNERAREAGRQFRHVITSIRLAPDGPQRLRSRAYLMILVTDGEGSRVDRSLVIEDAILLTDQGWQVALRTVRRDGPPTAN